MKKSAKLLSLILAALMLSPSFLSCSETTSGETQPVAAEPSVTEAVEEETSNYVSDDLPTVDYEGYNFNILSCTLILCTPHK